jgi:hypothetical protein
MREIGGGVQSPVAHALSNKARTLIHLAQVVTRHDVGGGDPLQLVQARPERAS